MRILLLDKEDSFTRDLEHLPAIYGRPDVEFSMAIRTGYLDTQAGFFHFFAGSGSAIHVMGAREYEETQSKAEKFLRPLKVGTP